MHILFRYPAIHCDAERVKDLPMSARWIWSLALIAALCAGVLPATARAAAPLDPHLRSALAAAAPADSIEAIVTYDAPPNTNALGRLSALGLRVAPFRRLPAVAVVGVPSRVRAAAGLAGVRGLYLNRRQELFLRESVAVIGADAVASQYGLSGAGVGVAVVDTGVDATHPDLAYGSTTVQNVKLLGLQAAAGQYLLPDAPAYALEGQATTDTTGGHGTHVAGIVAASGAASGGLYRGVAPGADLVGLGAGELIDIFTALAAFDYVLENRERYNIRVVNCSWGDIVRGFDPEHPINRATQALYDAGVSVVFAAGNDGAATDTLNTYSVAPWVIGVAAGEKDGRSVSSFSSRGIPGDDLFHPTLTAPGAIIVSDRTLTGAAVNPGSTPSDPLFIAPEHLPYYTAASGSSMAAPHVAGAIALMLEARPDLTPDVVRRLLVNSATPMPGFQEYAAGAGYLNALGAVELARAIKRVRNYRDPKTGRDERVYDLTERWEGSVAASAPGLEASDSHMITVAPGTRSLEVVIDWDLAASDLSLYLYAPDGSLAASSEVLQAVYGYASETVHLDSPAAGSWRAEVRGFLSAPQAYRGSANAVVALNP